MTTATAKGNEEALMELLSPDGYYTYLGIEKNAAVIDEKDPTKVISTIDEEIVKKNYRRLSLKHHPDKPNGDAETFRVLNRAQKVLMTPKLRQQYDILGIDLDDDDEHHHNHDNDGDHHADDGNETSSSQGIVQEIASTVLTGIIQFGVRTLMMGAVSIILVRYRLTLYPTIAFMGFITFRIVQQQSQVPGGTMYDTIPPIVIITGLLLMFNSVGVDEFIWTKQYWLGETLVITMFGYNSLVSYIPIINKTILLCGIMFISCIAALWFRGNVWNYITVIAIIAFIAIFVALAFPIMELLLETILNEKLKKVGEKVRHHHKIVQSHYANKKH